MELLDLILEKQNRFMNTLGTRFVFASDEFYEMANYPIPAYEEYEGFPQLENGVGLMRNFEHEIDVELNNIDEDIILNRKYIIATGTLAENFMNKIKDKITKKIKNLSIKVVPIKNNFFGELITVSGLITGQDILAQLKEYKDVDGIMIPKSMLRDNTDVFLDDLTVSDIQNKLKINIIPVEVSGKEFVSVFLKERGDLNG